MQIGTKNDYVRSLKARLPVTFCISWVNHGLKFARNYLCESGLGVNTHLLARGLPKGEDLVPFFIENDLKNEHIGKYVEKYLAGVEGVSTENRIRILRLLENMTGGTALVESMHGAGSPQT